MATFWTAVSPFCQSFAWFGGLGKREAQPKETYRVLLIQRDMREVLLSQAEMLRRRGGRSSALRPRALAAQYIGQERVVRDFLDARPGIGVLPLEYAEVLADPAGTAARIADFLAGTVPGLTFEVLACAAAIEPALRRQHAKPSVIGNHRPAG